MSGFPPISHGGSLQLSKWHQQASVTADGVLQLPVSPSPHAAFLLLIDLHTQSVNMLFVSQ